MDDWEYTECPTCGSDDAKYFACWNCGGEGGWHPYEACPLEYAPDEFEGCDICEGEGSYIICPNCNDKNDS